MSRVATPGEQAEPHPGESPALPTSSQVAVIGAGVMGAGIAEVALLAGHPVLLHDAAPGQADRAVGEISRRLETKVARGRLGPAQAAAARDRLRAVRSLGELADAALVIEAVAEALPVKREVFTELAGLVRADCVLATNTSSLSVTAIAAGLPTPGRVLGMHFFNPATRMPLVEIVSGLGTDEHLARLVEATARAWGKRAVRTGSTPGFLVNRVARPFYGEGLRALEQRAADPATIDAVLRESGGFPMGPLELVDLIGHDISEAVTRSVWAAYGYDPRYAPSVRQRMLVEAGRLGRKSGHGVYQYGPDATPPRPLDAPPGTAPIRLEAHGDLGPAAALPDLLAAAGLDIRRIPAARHTRDGYLILPEVTLRLCRGRTATAETAAAGHPVVLFDLALDYADATRIALAPPDGCPPAALAAANGMFHAIGKRTSVIDDTPGMLVTRTVAMLVNEAADALGAGVASAADIDAAMRHGVNYPRGPLAWGDQLGPAWVVDVLEALGREHGDGRYRATPLLRRRALSGRSLRDG
jgi:3-hydroxybutyryl-CoA dehydrogenase